MEERESTFCNELEYLSLNDFSSMSESLLRDFQCISLSSLSLVTFSTFARYWHPQRHICLHLHQPSFSRRASRTIIVLSISFSHWFPSRYLLGSGGTFVFDVTIVSQSFIYRGKPPRRRGRGTSISHRASLAEEQACLLGGDALSGSYYGGRSASVVRHSRTRTSASRPN